MMLGGNAASEVRAAVFDVDGVLLDSLPAHLAICRDKSREFKFPLSIPTARELRNMVRRGVTISPMKEFFRAVGFPEELAARADSDYKRDFARDYRSPPFAGVAPMLARLAEARVVLGFVTSNTLKNVSRGLGDLMRYFGEFAFSCDHPREQSKLDALRELLKTMGVAADNAVYVGDQPADARAATQAGMKFLGVTYGWGLDRGDSSLRTVDSPAELADALLDVLHVPRPQRQLTYG